jgi:methionyl aminopeptidase
VSSVKRILRSTREIRKMRAAGLIVWQSHQAAKRILQPGVTTAELNAAIADTFRIYGATPLFLGYPGELPYPAESCISINEEVVHGIPGNRKLKVGDVVSLDTGCRFNGWCGDAAITHAVGRISERAQKLLDVTLATLNLSIELMSTKKMWSEIASEMQAFVQDHGFSVVEAMTGHGIGQEMHEPPQVPNFWNDHMARAEDFDIRPGVVIAVEPMVNMGVKEVQVLDDKWTTVTADLQASAHFEHTVAITGDGPVRLTGPPSDQELAEMPRWLHDKDAWVVW